MIAANTKIPHPITAKPKILLAEYEKITAALTLNHLRRAISCDVTHALDGYEALGAIKQAKFSLVIVGTWVPYHKDIGALAEELQATMNGKKVPMISLFSTHRETDFKATLSDPKLFDAYIQVPYDYVDLIRVVKQQIGA